MRHRGAPPLPPFEVKPDGSLPHHRWPRGIRQSAGTVAGRMRCTPPRSIEPQWSVHAGVHWPLWKNFNGMASQTTVIKADIGSPKDVKRNDDKTPFRERAAEGRFPPRYGDRRRPALRAHPGTVAQRHGTQGAWSLSRRMNTRRTSLLDCFVMFSSVSSIFGNPAQGSDPAANAFLDCLPTTAGRWDLPALAINWGVLGGEGYVAPTSALRSSWPGKAPPPSPAGGDHTHGILPRRARHPDGSDSRGLGEVASSLPEPSGQSLRRAHLCLGGGGNPGNDRCK